MVPNTGQGVDGRVGKSTGFALTGGDYSSMKAYFYTGSFTHPFYKELFRYPPQGWEWFPSSQDLISEGMKKDLAQSSRWYYPFLRRNEQTVLSILSFARIPKLRWIRHPECDLIHSAQYPLMNRHPWVMDFEDISTVSWYRPDVLAAKHVQQWMQSLFVSPWCRGLFPWTHAAKRSLEAALDVSSFKEKIQVVYPVKTPRPDLENIFRERQRQKKLRVLFVGTSFYTKGGAEALAVMDKLCRSSAVEFVMISNTPESIRSQYAHHPGIIFERRVSNERLNYYYRTSHLFLAPYHTDTFGFVILEAFSYGIPCIATDQFAIPEIIRHGKTGMIVENNISRFNKQFLPMFDPVVDDRHPMMPTLINPPTDYLDRLSEAIYFCLSRPESCAEMGRQAANEVTTGRFSPHHRQRILSEAYQRCAMC